MKSLIISILLLFISTGAFAGKDSVFVKLQGDTVQIWNTNAQTNCCSHFVFEVSILNDTINVLERDTSSSLCRCYCLFDFNVSLTGLTQGNYMVFVYRKDFDPDLDTIRFVGSTSFSIGSSIFTYKITHQYQSTCGGSTGIFDGEGGTPRFMQLFQNYPNPFNPVTTIRYQLPVQSYVTLKIFDVLGGEVATLVDGIEEPGYRSINFNANSTAGGLSSGVYYYRIVANTIHPGQAGGYIETKKLLLLK